MRYWKILVILVIILGSIGTYYIQEARAGNKDPEFTFETVNGDANEVENLILTGMFVNQQGYGEQIDISTEGTTYQRDLPYLKQLKFYSDPEIERLQREYRSFMRGKGENSSSFYENKDVLVHVGPSWIEKPETPLQIDILDKETGKENAFEAEIPENQNAMYLRIVEVQFVNNELHVMTISDTEEVHVYRMEIEKEAFVGDQTLDVTKEETDMDWIQISELNGSHVMQERDSYIFGILHMQEVQEEENHSILHEKMEYAAYHFESGEFLNLDVPKEIEEKDLVPYVDQDTIYFVDTLNNKLQIKAYSLDEGEIHTMDVQTEEDSIYSNSLIHVQNGTIYLVNYQEERAKLYVMDAKTEEVLYEGKIGLSNPNDMPEHNHLDFSGMRIK